MRFGEIRPEENGPTIGGDGMVELSLGLEGNSEIVVGFGAMGAKADGALVGGDRFVEKLPLVCRRTLPRRLCAPRCKPEPERWMAIR